VATVVTVHGTFAHSAGTADALNIGEGGEAQWWQAGSEFERDLKRWVNGADGQPIEFMPFTWSSLNSELDRRSAGTELLKTLRRLDERNEPYCLVGHSHGGSVIASALIDSAAKKKRLPGLRRWITVGTPFVGMRKERFLFTRLSLARKVVFVASLMLFMMFLFYVVGELFGAGFRLRSERYYIGLLFSGTMLTLPIVVFYLVFRYLDGRELSGYGRGVVQRAHQAFQDKWLPLVHKDDEAVQGLRTLPKVKLHFFGDDFAASTITKAAIVALPLLYLFVVTSAPIMLGISDFLQTKVYGVQEFANAADPVNKASDELTNLANRMRDAQDQSERSGLDPARSEDARRQAGEYRRQLREKRRQIDQSLPQFAQVKRAERFKRRFLMKAGQPCEGGRLCGGGHDYALNSKLLYHVVTDELSSAVVDETALGGAMGGVLRLLTPIVLVPVAFAALALVVLALIEFVARHVSVYISRALNYLTMSEVKRSSFGNDTEGEVVLGADYGPSWLDPVTCILPMDVCNGISDHSNTVTADSLAKFRSAISSLAFPESQDNITGQITNYLSWKELVHTCYFDLKDFRAIVAQSISRADGFQASDAFRRDPVYDRSAVWLSNLGRQPETEILPLMDAGAQPQVQVPA
jgi:hypothetical protein